MNGVLSLLKNVCLANDLVESPYTASMLSVSGWKLSGGEGVEFSEQCIRLNLCAADF